MSYIGIGVPLSGLSHEQAEAVDGLDAFKKKFETNYGSLDAQIVNKVTLTNVAGQKVFTVAHNPATVKVWLRGAKLVKTDTTDTTFANGDFYANGTTITLAANVADNSYALEIESEGLAGITVPQIQEQVPVGSTMLWFSDQAIPIGYLPMLGQNAAALAAYPALLTRFPTGLPNTEHYFVRGAGPTRPVKTVESDAIRNITATFNQIYAGNSGIASGAMSVTTSGNIVLSTSAGATQKTGTYTFDASAVVPVASENRPINISAFYIVKAYSALNAGGEKTVEAQLKQITELMMSASAMSVPAGITAMWSSSAGTIPTGWLPIFGQTYAELAPYPALQRLYPSGLPDTRGRFARGVDGVSRLPSSLENDRIRDHYHNHYYRTEDNRTNETLGSDITSQLWGSPASYLTTVGDSSGIKVITAASPTGGATTASTIVASIDNYSMLVSGQNKYHITIQSTYDIAPSQYKSASDTNETRPINFGVYFIVKAYDYAHMPEAADFTQVVQVLKPAIEGIVAANDAMTWNSTTVNGVSTGYEIYYNNKGRKMMRQWIYTQVEALGFAAAGSFTTPYYETRLFQWPVPFTSAPLMTAMTGVNASPPDNTNWTDQTGTWAVSQQNVFCSTPSGSTGSVRIVLQRLNQPGIGRYVYIEGIGTV